MNFGHWEECEHIEDRNEANGGSGAGTSMVEHQGGKAIWFNDRAGKDHQSNVLVRMESVQVSKTGQTKKWLSCSVQREDGQVHITFKKQGGRYPIVNSEKWPFSICEHIAE